MALRILADASAGVDVALDAAASPLDAGPHDPGLPARWVDAKPEAGGALCRTGWCLWGRARISGQPRGEVNRRHDRAFPHGRWRRWVRLQGLVLWWRHPHSDSTGMALSGRLGKEATTPDVVGFDGGRRRAGQSTS